MAKPLNSSPPGAAQQRTLSALLPEIDFFNEEQWLGLIRIFKPSKDRLSKGGRALVIALDKLLKNISRHRVSTSRKTKPYITHQSQDFAPVQVISHAYYDDLQNASATWFFSYLSVLTSLVVVTGEAAGGGRSRGAALWRYCDFLGRCMVAVGVLAERASAFVTLLAEHHLRPFQPK